MRLDAIEDAAVYGAAQEAGDERAARAHARMFAELATALQSNPSARVYVPGYDLGDNHWQAHEVVADWACGDPTIWIDAIRVIAQASESTEPALRLAAQAWQARVCKMHADHHCEAED